MIDRASDRPAYRQIADLLREQIRAEQISPGESLPSVRQLASDHGVTDVIARRAIGLLRNEGLIDTQPGKGSFVRGSSSNYRVSSERYGKRHRAAGRTPFMVDTAALGSPKVEVTRFEPVPAPPAIAARLELPPDSQVLVQGLKFHAGGRVMQTSTAYIPFDLVDGTALADPDTRPWERDTISNLEDLGIRVDEVEEEHSSRMPWPEETRALQLREGVPVLVTERAMRAGQRPVEVCDIVMGADQYRLRHRIPIDQATDVRMVTSVDELHDELRKVVDGAQEHLIALGSRSRDQEYLAAVEAALEERPRLTHYRVLFGPPRRQVLQDHLQRLLELRDPKGRSQGTKTMHLGLIEDPDEPERNLVANEHRAVVILPSFNAAENCDTAIVIRDPDHAQRLVEHAKQLYASSQKVETAEALRALQESA